MQPWCGQVDESLLIPVPYHLLFSSRAGTWAMPKYRFWNVRVGCTTMSHFFSECIDILTNAVI